MPTTTVQPAATLFDDVKETAALAPVPAEIQAEVVEEQDRQRAAIDALVHLDPAKVSQALANRQTVLVTLRSNSIRESRPHDWVLYREKDEAGDRIVGVPCDSLLVRIMPLWGIEVFNYNPKGPNGPDPELGSVPAVYDSGERRGQPVLDGKGQAVVIQTATMWADGRCRLTGGHVEGVSVTVQADRFAGSGSAADLKASCRTSLQAKVCRILTGLRKVAAEELEACGVDWKRARKGHGFGTSAERGAGRVADAGVAEAAAALRDDILKRVGGDKDAARQLCREITANPDSRFKGFDTVDRLTQGWQVEQATKRLRAHPQFGDQKEGGA